MGDLIVTAMEKIFNKVFNKGFLQEIK